jgi:hypothetical protein
MASTSAGELSSGTKVEAGAGLPLPQDLMRTADAPTGNRLDP